MAHWEAVLGDRLPTLDYEALVADPEPLTRAMVAHVGLEWDDACLRPREVARNGAHRERVAGSPARVPALGRAGPALRAVSQSAA